MHCTCTAFVFVSCPNIHSQSFGPEMALQCMQIVIWDGATGAKVKQLEGHSSYVKGVAWDPVGTYLASQVQPQMQKLCQPERSARLPKRYFLIGKQIYPPGLLHSGSSGSLTDAGPGCLLQGDDKALVVWRTDDWTPIATITEPFQRWVSLAFSLRCAHMLS